MLSTYYEEVRVVAGASGRAAPRVLKNRRSLEPAAAPVAPAPADLEASLPATGGQLPVNPPGPDEPTRTEPVPDEPSSHTPPPPARGGLGVRGVSKIK